MARDVTSIEELMIQLDTIRERSLAVYSWVREHYTSDSAELAGCNDLLASMQRVYWALTGCRNPDLFGTGKSQEQR